MTYVEDMCIIRDTKSGEKLVSIAKTKSNMFSLDVARVGKVNVAMNVRENSRLWHLRLGHLNFNALRSMMDHGMVQGLPNIIKLQHC